MEEIKFYYIIGRKTKKKSENSLQQNREIWTNKTLFLSDVDRNHNLFY